MHSSQEIDTSRLLANVCGVDIVELDEFRRVLDVGGECFLRRIYTKAELLFCHNRLPQLAGRFAGKEAVAKAIGTGMRGISWQDIEVLSTAEGRPFILLHGYALDRAAQLGMYHWDISISHSPNIAMAFVISSRVVLVDV